MTRALFTTFVLAAMARVAYGADDKAAADALITKGLELRREGRGLEAIELFQKADAIEPTPRSVGQLGLAESAVEHWSDAEEHLDGALATPEDPWVKKNRPALDQALELARTHVGQISLSGRAGAAIVISGRSVGTLPIAKPIRVNAGPALVTATALGFKQFEMSVPVEAGKETQLRIELEALDLPPPPTAAAARPPVMTLQQPTAADASTRSSRRSWTGASLLAGGAGLAGWGIYWIAIDGHSSGGSCSAGAPPGCVRVYSTRTPGIVLTGVGAAGLVAGSILLYSTRTHSTEVGVAATPSSVNIAGRF